MRKQQIVKIDPEQYNELQKSIATILKEFTGVKQKINPEAWYDNQDEILKKMPPFPTLHQPPQREIGRAHV